MVALDQTGPSHFRMRARSSFKAHQHDYEVDYPRFSLHDFM
jgi:hypothetical protein